MSKFVVSVSFRHEICLICKRNVQIDTKLSKNLMPILSFLMLFRSKFQNHQLNNERTSHELHFLKRTLQRFASKTLQNDSKAVEKFKHLRFRATCVLFESFWSQNVGKRSTKTKPIIQ